MTSINATTRKLRKDRAYAVRDFLQALGFDATTVRSVSIEQGKIRITTFLVNGDGEQAKVPNQAGQLMPLMQESVLFTTQGDLDQMDTMANALGINVDEIPELQFVEPTQG